jgi:hypothetical protein
MGSSIPSPATWDTSWVGPRQWSCLLVSVCCVRRSLRHLGPHHVEQLGRRRRVRRPQRRARLRARRALHGQGAAVALPEGLLRQPLLPGLPWLRRLHTVLLLQRRVGATRLQLRLRWLRLRLRFIRTWARIMSSALRPSTSRTFFSTTVARDWPTARLAGMLVI